MQINTNLVTQIQRLQAQDFAARFWNFSEEIYRKDDLRERLLEAQDSKLRNINLILFLCFAYQQRVPLHLAKLISDCSSSDVQIKAFRQQRRQQKALLSTLEYRDLCQRELELERMQQQLLLWSAQDALQQSPFSSQTKKASDCLDEYLASCPMLLLALKTELIPYMV